MRNVHSHSSEPHNFKTIRKTKEALLQQSVDLLVPIEGMLQNTSWKCGQAVQTAVQNLVGGMRKMISETNDVLLRMACHPGDLVSAYWNVSVDHLNGYWNNIKHVHRIRSNKKLSHEFSCPGYGRLNTQTQWQLWEQIIGEKRQNFDPLLSLWRQSLGCNVGFKKMTLLVYILCLVSFNYL